MSRDRATIDGDIAVKGRNTKISTRCIDRAAIDGDILLGKNAVCRLTCGNELPRALTLAIDENTTGTLQGICAFCDKLGSIHEDEVQVAIAGDLILIHDILTPDHIPVITIVEFC